MSNLKQGTGSYEKEMQRSLHNQFAREDKQRMMGVNTNDPADVNAAAPEMPDSGATVLCMFCGSKIPTSREGVPQRVVDRERKFRTCQKCRVGIVGSGGVLDRSTPNLQDERKFK